MMTEAEIKAQIETLERQRVELLANLNATEGAIAAFKMALNPPSQQPTTPTQQA